ncbi:MAG: hypothetical protein RR470_12590 [Vagococcus sp.]|uniref:hypothetical protein n=1 Tax=Vagococcus sp. TaxID=1933889 RepID=UPI002FC5F46C
MMNRVEDVFGVNNKIIKTYHERAFVDGKLKQALSSNKHIVIYGQSKQGKTSLLNKCLLEENRLSINCSNDTTVQDIYNDILKSEGVKIETSSKINGSEEVSVTPKLSANINFGIVKGTGGVSGESKEINGYEAEYTSITYDLSKAKNIAEILIEKSMTKKIIIEDFHYLSEDCQKKFAYDLKIFFEKGIIFIILGIWKEKDKLIQYNRELTDRLEFISVEPWEEKDFNEIFLLGQKELDISIPVKIKYMITSNSFNNVGIFQELCKYTSLNCINRNSKEVTEEDFENALEFKKETYFNQHQRILEKIANNDSGKLYLAYYFVKCIFDTRNEKLVNGLNKKYILFRMTQSYHDKSQDLENVISRFLNTSLKDIQIKLEISPLIFDYDRQDDIFRILDSTLLFFLHNTDKRKVFEGMSIPDELDRLIKESKDIEIPPNRVAAYQVFLEMFDYADNNEIKRKFLDM